MTEDRYERVKTLTALDEVLLLAHCESQRWRPPARVGMAESIATVEAHRDALRESLSNG
jgi:hypothetical protein